jgi:8-oxo-dGTP diphosphatase
MPLARFVRFHAVSEQESALLPPPRFALMIARARDGVVLVSSRFRKVWELPGGLIDPGESWRQAAERELFEESGCRARDSQWLGLVEVSDGATHFGAVYRCEVDAVPAHFENAETLALGRWRRGDAPQPMGHSDAALLEEFG